LSDTSTKDKPWDKHHAESQLVAALYRQSNREDFQRLAERMELCAPVLNFGQVVNPDTGEIGYRLHQAFLCRVRNCPTCSWRKSLKWRERLKHVLPDIEAEYPSHRWLFLTLTVRNPCMADLKSTIAAMRYGWRKLTGYADWPAIGAIRSLEVTHGQDGRPHPHFHCLILVPAGYFSSQGGYLKHSEWVRLWRKAMKLDYDPGANVKPIKPREGDAHPMQSAISECLKYSVKPSDLTSDPEWLYAITDQLHGTRAVEVFGVLKPFLREMEKEEDLVHIVENGMIVKARNEGGHFFPYYEGYKRYARRRKAAEAS
jgi:plasmid rolling circle replication initiator protein Rep